MSLAKRLQDEKPNARPRFETIIDALPEADRAALKAVVADPDFPTSAILRALHAEGIKVGKDALATWRRSNGYEPRT